MNAQSLSIRTQGQFARLVSKPIVIIFGDYIPTEAKPEATTLGGSNWQVRWLMAQEFVKTVKAHGGDITLIHLPELGITGNFHFLMQEKNNGQIANLVEQWLKSKKL